VDVEGPLICCWFVDGFFEQW